MGSTLFHFLSHVFYLASAAHGASMNCQLGTTLALGGKARHKCQIVGHSETGKQSPKTFYASCEGKSEDRQLEYLEGSGFAQLVDPASRQEVTKCKVNEKQFSVLIQDYEKHDLELENPKCYLTQWKGQMMYVAEGVKGRCSFNMSKNRSQEFKNKTGVTPLYQCENDYFLSIGEKTAASVYKKSKDGWQLACKATIRTGEPVEPIDWKNPPDYYVPEAAVLGPKPSIPAG
ncbi:MAG: hypothetical protein ACXVA9_01520 [Bdellovibrionales bacterium]